MNQFVLFILLCPLLSAAQDKTNRFENDTLYTSCGYKIYEGQTLHFGKINWTGGFRYIAIKNGISAASLQDNSAVVTKLSKYGSSATGNATIHVKAAINFRDGSKGIVLLI